MDRSRLLDPRLRGSEHHKAPTIRRYVRIRRIGRPAQTTSIRLQGAPKIESEGTEIPLTSASLEDGNSVERLRKVAPVTRKASGMGETAPM